MRLTQLTLATASSVLVLATLAACGSEPAAPAESADAPVAVEREGGPGASGRIADIDGKTVQVGGTVGEADDTGAVTAAQISVTDGVDGQCGMVMRVDREGER